MILVNGEAGHVIDVQDRGLMYGDGVFETIAVIDNQPRLLEQHWCRLEQGCHRLNIMPPPRSDLMADLQHLLDRENAQNHVLKFIITRGPGGRGYRYQPHSSVTRIAMQSEWPAHYATRHENGVRCTVCMTRLASQPLLAGIKHLNRLEQVLARAEWTDESIDEGIMLDHSGNIIEATMSNIFFVTDEARLVTPSLEDCGISGVQRAHVIELAESNGVECQVREVKLPALENYQEVFLTNSLIGIWPVVSIDKHHFDIGPLTRMLQQRLNIHG